MQHLFKIMQFILNLIVMSGFVTESDKRALSLIVQKSLVDLVHERKLNKH